MHDIGNIFVTWKPRKLSNAARFIARDWNAVDIAQIMFMRTISYRNSPWVVQIDARSEYLSCTIEEEQRHAFNNRDEQYNRIRLFRTKLKKMFPQMRINFQLLSSFLRQNNQTVYLCIYVQNENSQVFSLNTSFILVLQILKLTCGHCAGTWNVENDKETF